MEQQIENRPPGGMVMDHVKSIIVRPETAQNGRQCQRTGRESVAEVEYILTSGREHIEHLGQTALDAVLKDATAAFVQITDER